MIILLVRLIMLLTPFYSSFAFACLPHEIHIREHFVKSYIKKDGTKVPSYIRSEHCREIKTYRFFQNTNDEKIKGLQTDFKVWEESEKSLINKEIESLPSWLGKYKLSKILRANKEARNPNNPAMVIPATKTLIIFDKFFTMQNKRDVIIHEMAHIAIWDVDPENLKSFLVSKGWKYESNGKIIPPEKVITPDSRYSPSEDFANSVEIYYSDRLRLKNFNSQAFQILEDIIKSKESVK